MNSGIKVNYLRNRYILNSIGIYAMMLKSLKITHYSQVLLTKNSKINIVLSGTLYKYKLHLYHAILEFDKSINRYLQLVINTGNIKYYYNVILLGIGCRFHWKHYKIQGGVDILSPGLYAGMWFDF